MAGVSIPLICRAHGSELIPVFCTDCEQCMCLECVTSDHVQHCLSKITDVVQRHVEDMKTKLDPRKGHSYRNKLKDISSNLDKAKTALTTHTEETLCDIKRTEEEIIEKAKSTSQKLTATVLQMHEKYEKPLEMDQYIIKTVLNEKQLQPDFEKKFTEFVFLSSTLKKIEMAYDNKRPYFNENCFEFNMSDALKSMDEYFGKVTEDHCNSSDFIEYGTDNEDASSDDEYLECLDVHLRFRIGYETIQQILPNGIFESYVLTGSSVLKCSFKDGLTKYSVLLHDVVRISDTVSGDILAILWNRTTIMRISKHGETTTFFKTGKGTFEHIIKSNESYAGVLLKGAGKSEFESCYNLYLLDDNGCVIKIIDNFYVTCCSCDVLDTKPTDCANRFLFLDSINLFGIGNCFLYDVACGKTIFSYNGCLGIDMKSSFIATGVCTDTRGDFIIAVPNDKAVHLIDNKGTFQKLLLTEEDGLNEPYSVALDDSGYLWIGCYNGFIHIADYRYLLNVGRQSRIKYLK